MDIKEFQIKVTGERDFGTGAQRDPNEDKGRFDLISPIFLSRLAKHTQKGGQARGDRNWEAGMPTGVTLDSALRHINTFIEGNRDEDHLAAAAWNIMVTIHVLEMIDRGLMHDELNNLPDFTGKPEPDVGYCSEHGDHPAGDGCPGCKRERYEDFLETYPSKVQQDLAKEMLRLDIDPRPLIKTDRLVPRLTPEHTGSLCDASAEEVQEYKDHAAKTKPICIGGADCTCNLHSALDKSPDAGVHPLQVKHCGNCYYHENDGPDLSQGVCNNCTRCSMWVPRGVN